MGQGTQVGNLGAVLYFESWFVAQCVAWLFGQGHRMSTADTSRLNARGGGFFPHFYYRDFEIFDMY